MRTSNTLILNVHFEFKNNYFENDRNNAMRIVNALDIRVVLYDNPTG